MTRLKDKMPIKFRYKWSCPRAWCGPYRVGDPKYKYTYNGHKPDDQWVLFEGRVLAIGKQDRNGVEMYEGDQVRYNHSVAKHNLPLKYTGYIRWDAENCRFVVDCPDDIDRELFWDVIEVIPEEG